MKLGGKCVRLYTDKYLENIGSMFRTLYKDELLTDCILHCKDGSIKAHKLILAASSPYFRKVFLEHDEKHAIFIMYGVSAGPLKDLLELIYKGSINVPGDTLGSVFDLADELQVTGVLAEDGAADNNYNGCGRDTRYKGQKRVAVNFTGDESETIPAKITKSTSERRSSSGSEIVIKKPSQENLSSSTNDENSDTSDDIRIIADKTGDGDNERYMGHPVDEQSTLSVWARKERKFKCDLCPSSFKRASHLTRHQLVHTGERPFACNQCDKAFSRHDKLKHHIHKAHELGALNDALPPDSLYTIGHVRILTPEQTMVESPEPIVQNPQPVAPPAKKGRGRPRKYPINTYTNTAPPPLVKRPRGRPRLNPIVPPEPATKRENYDISNMPYGDLEYLTKPLTVVERNEGNISLEQQDIMEPLVEIKTEPSEKPEVEKEPQTSGSFLENIGLFENSAIAKIGECTISVANNSNNSAGGPTAKTV